jgi:hypothetical protein
MIADTARALGFTKFEPTKRVLKMADQSRVLPVGMLSNLGVIIGDKPFRLSFMVMEPEIPSTYPMLLGRPWLYLAKVHTSWGKKTFTFGKPKTEISWAAVPHEGETSSTDSGYTSEESSGLDQTNFMDSIQVESEDENLNVSGLFSTDEVYEPELEEPEVMIGSRHLK